MALYGAPVWSERACVRRYRAMFNSLQRTIAIRIARGYRTISFEAATLLARFPPLDILSEMDTRVYNQLHGLVDEAVPATTAEMRRTEHQRALRLWRERLNEPKNTRQRAVGAILPVFEAWQRRKRRLTYRLTQILTGHGCFGEYLNRIGREITPQCHHCGAGQDSAQHTLEQCPAWSSERRILQQNIGQDLSLPSVVAAMLADENVWQQVTSFCETVMVQKEVAERDRERADPARRRRRRGAGNSDPVPSAP